MKIRYILTTIVIFLVMMFAVIGCGGGGGSSTSGGGDTTLPNITSGTIPELLDQQNSKVEAYFSKVEELLKSSSSIDEELFGIDPADTDIVDNILDDIEKNYLLSQDISKIGEEINEIEQRIQGNSLSMANPIKQKNYKRSSDIYSFEPLTIAVATYTVCMPFVTVYAATLALEHSAIKKQEDGNICREKYIAVKRHVNEMEASEADKNATLVEGWNDFWDCRRRAGGSANERDLFTMFTASGSLLLSLPSAPVGAIAQTMSAASSVGDTATILEHGTVFTFGTRSDSDDKKNPKSFMSVSDSNGKLVVPEGDWNIAAFAPGYVRFGTRDGQSISVKEGETTVASIYTVPTESASSSDFESCNDDVEAGCIEGVKIHSIDDASSEDSISDPTVQDIANAYISVSGSVDSLRISWKSPLDAYWLSVDQTGESRAIYGISGKLDGEGGRHSFTPPVLYGDYSIVNTRVGGQEPSPALTDEGVYNLYTVEVHHGSSDSGYTHSSEISFSFCQ